MPVQDCNATWIWISLFERTPGCAWTNTFRHHLDTAEIGILLASAPFVFCADILDSLQCLQAPDTSPNRTLNCAFFASASNENRQAPISPKQTNKIKLELDIIYGRQKLGRLSTSIMILTPAMPWRNCLYCDHCCERKVLLIKMSIFIIHIISYKTDSSATLSSHFSADSHGRLKGPALSQNIQRYIHMQDNNQEHTFTWIKWHSSFSTGVVAWVYTNLSLSSSCTASRENTGSAFQTTLSVANQPKLLSRSWANRSASWISLGNPLALWLWQSILSCLLLARSRSSHSVHSILTVWSMPIQFQVSCLGSLPGHCCWHSQPVTYNRSHINVACGSLLVRPIGWQPWCHLSSHRAAPVPCRSPASRAAWSE